MNAQGASVRIATAALVIFAAVTACHAVVVTDNPADHVVEPGSTFSGVGYLNSAGGTTGVLLNSRHVLTARHVGAKVGTTFTLQGDSGPETYSVVALHNNPDCDMAVLVLDRPANHGGYDIYTGSEEYGKEVAVVGVGVSGTGQPQSAYPRGTLREARNKLTLAYGGLLMYSFEQPGSAGSVGVDEGMAAMGDSGSPVFIYDQGSWKIAGITRSVGDANYDGLIGSYGDRAILERVSANIPWITENMNAPEPATLGLLALGTLGILVRKRRA